MTRNQWQVVAPCWQSTLGGESCGFRRQTRRRRQTSSAVRGHASTRRPLPNGSRLSCGRLRPQGVVSLNDSPCALAHNTPLPLERSPPGSFKRLLGCADSCCKCNRTQAAGQGSLVAHSHARLPYPCWPRFRRRRPCTERKKEKSPVTPRQRRAQTKMNA